jgi:xanthine dehydrogenase accessory factor
VPTAKLARTVGFRVVVIDPRQEFANRERFPDVDEIVNEDFTTAAERLRIDDDTYVIVMSPDHLKDEDVIEKTVGKNSAYVGMIGSESKALLTLHSLKKKVPEETLRKVKTPMGLEIGAQTPEEIAVSIVAELIRIKRGGTGESMSVAQKERF